ncbi:MAG: hypothetical protein ACOVSR_02910 [Bacteroidia bacterium]
MGVSKFAYPEKIFFDYKSDPNTRSFLSGVDIDLTSDCKFGLPTLEQVKFAIAQTSYDYIEGKIIEDFGRQRWANSLSKNGEIMTAIYIDNVKNDKDEIDSISFERGDETAILEFLWHLSKFCGSILFYVSAGNMTLVRTDRTMERIREDLGY